jgi:hypothetical protein
MTDRTSGRDNADFIYLSTSVDAKACAVSEELFRRSIETCRTVLQLYQTIHVTGRHRFAIITLHVPNNLPMSGGAYTELTLSHYTCEKLYCDDMELYRVGHIRCILSTC